MWYFALASSVSSNIIPDKIFTFTIDVDVFKKCGQISINKLLRDGMVVANKLKCAVELHINSECTAR